MSVKLRQFFSQVEGNKYKSQTLLHPVAKEPFDEEKKAIIQSLIDCIDARFQNMNTDPVFTSSKIFDPKTGQLMTQKSQVMVKKNLTDY